MPAEMEERAMRHSRWYRYITLLWLTSHNVLVPFREFVNDILGPNDDISTFEYIKRKKHKGKGPVLIGI